MIVPSIVNGKELVGSSEPVLDHHGKELYSYSPVGWETLDSACETAQNGFVAWSLRTRADRAAVFRRTAELLRKNKLSHIQAHVEIGGSPTFAAAIVDASIENIFQYAAVLAQPEGVIPTSDSTKLALVMKAPVGPVLSIAPWNGPLVLWMRAIAAPLAAGCSVIGKAPEKAPLSAYLMVKEFLDNGVNPEALQLLHFKPQDHPEGTARLIANPRIRKINFTGLTPVGRKVAEIAGANLKPVTLELGGKNVFIVKKDADLEKAADSALFSAWFHKGQICMSLDSVYVDESVYEEFLAVLKEKAKTYPLTHELSIPFRDAVGAAKVDALVSDAIAKKAEIVHGEHPGPIILANITPEMNIHTHETFGPVFSVYKFLDVSEPITKINDANYSLKVAVWSKDVLSAIGDAKQIQCGGIHINSSTIHDEPGVPHGGVGNSGSGNFNSEWGVNEFTYIKTITAS